MGLPGARKPLPKSVIWRSGQTEGGEVTIIFVIFINLFKLWLMSIETAIQEIKKAKAIDSNRLVELVGIEYAVSWYKDALKNDLVEPAGRPTYELRDLPLIIRLTKKGQEQL